MAKKPRDRCQLRLTGQESLVASLASFEMAYYSLLTGLNRASEKVIDRDRVLSMVRTIESMRFKIFRELKGHRKAGVRPKGANRNGRH